MPARNPTNAPSAGVMGCACPCCSAYAAATPPQITHRQQQMLPAAMIGSADRTPMTRAPMRTGWNLIVVVFTTEVRDQLLALQVPERVLQLHQLDEQVVLGVQAGGVDGRLEIER